MKIDKNYFLKILKEEFEEVSVEGLPYNLDIIKKDEKTYLKISYDMDLFLYTALEMKFVSKFVKDNVLNDISDLKIIERYVEFFNDGIVNEVNNVDKKEVYIPFKEIFPTLSLLAIKKIVSTDLSIEDNNSSEVNLDLFISKAIMKSDMETKDIKSDKHNFII